MVLHQFQQRLSYTDKLSGFRKKLRKSNRTCKGTCMSISKLTALLVHNRKYRTSGGNAKQYWKIHQCFDCIHSTEMVSHSHLGLLIIVATEEHRQDKRTTLDRRVPQTLALLFSPIQTSPKQPCPSFLCIDRVSLDTSQASRPRPMVSGVQLGQGLVR